MGMGIHPDLENVLLTEPYVEIKLLGCSIEIQLTNCHEKVLFTMKNPLIPPRVSSNRMKIEWFNLQSGELRHILLPQ